MVMPGKDHYHYPVGPGLPIFIAMNALNPVWILLLVLALGGCREKQEYVYATRADITESVYATAVVRPEGEYRAAANQPGLIAAMHVTEGQLVQAGDALFTIENDIQGLNEANARLAYEQARNNYQGSSSRLVELQQQVTLESEALALDSLEYYRQKNLWEQRIGSQAELDRKRLAYYASRSRYLTALNRYHLTETELKNALDQARNQYEISRQRTTEYTVHARMAGRVYDLFREAGEYATQLEPLVLLGSDTSFLLDMQVDERDIARVEPGQTVLITMDSYAGQVFEARVKRIIPRMDEQSQSFRVEAVFSEAPPRLYPFLSAEANIVVASKDDVLLVPRSALHNGDRVVLKGGDTAQVAIGLKSLEYVEILDGINESDALIKAR